MKMENVEFIIPQKYLDMSVDRLENTAREMLEQINSIPKKIRKKKKATAGKKEIDFYM